MAENKGLFNKIFGKKDAKDKVEEVVEEVKDEALVAAENAKRVAEAAQRKAETEARKAEFEAKKLANEADAKLQEAQREKLDEAKTAAREKAEELAAARETASKRDLLNKQEVERAAAEAAKYIDSYTVAADDTLSHIALRFYGKATPAYYTLIYEANKDVIGDNMNVVIPGQVLRIPALPDELK